MKKYFFLFQLVTLVSMLFFSCKKNSLPLFSDASVFPIIPVDSTALYLFDNEKNEYNQGKKDVSAKLQEAINYIEEHHDHGIVFIPPGYYRLDSTIRLWRGIRLIGYGKTRPVLVCKNKADSATRHVMIHFCNRRSDTIENANNITFYSGINNINFFVEKGNHGVIAARFRVAQHSSIENAEFILNDAYCGIFEAGNELENCRFTGGNFGIVTERTSAGWQTLLFNCCFEGQKTAAVSTKEAGITAINCHFNQQNDVFLIPNKQYEQLVLAHAIVKNVSGAVISFDKTIVPIHSPMFNIGKADHNQLQQINISSLLCENVSRLFHIRDADTSISLVGKVLVNDACYGFNLQEQDYKTTISYSDTLPSHDSLILMKVPAVPSSEKWVNVNSLGIFGDTQADYTNSLREAIKKHTCLYFPQGNYIVTDSIRLAPGTCIIGLHPYKTAILLRNGNPLFADTTSPRAIFYSSKGYNNLISGVGIDPGMNKGGVGVYWEAGEYSLIDDVLMGIDERKYSEWPKGEDQYASLLVEGGGGYFKNIWSHDIINRRAILVKNSNIPGIVMLISAEHHRDMEVEFSHVDGWHVYALQTEENLRSENATAIGIYHCRNMKFYNTFNYRVMASPRSFPYGIDIVNPNNICFHGFHSFSWGKNPFENGFRVKGELIETHEASRVCF